MNKKAMTFKEVVVLAILLVFLIAFLMYVVLGPEAILPKVAIIAGRFGDWVFTDTGKNIVKTQQEVPEDISNLYNSLVEVYSDNSEGPCLLSHVVFPNDFKGYKIKISKLSNKGLFIELLDKDEKTIESYEVEKIFPCVVAGSKDITNNFISNYLKGDSSVPSEKKQDYNIYNSIEIKTDINILPDAPYIEFNGFNPYIEDKGLMFKTKQGNVCFFPTGDFWPPGCNGEEEGLDDDCLTDMFNGKTTLKFCSKLEPLDNFYTKLLKCSSSTNSNCLCKIPITQFKKKYNIVIEKESDEKSNVYYKDDVNTKKEISMLPCYLTESVCKSASYNFEDDLLFHFVEMNDGNIVSYVSPNKDSKIPACGIVQGSLIKLDKKKVCFYHESYYNVHYKNLGKELTNC
jgi:hypothetical protein